MRPSDGPGFVDDAREQIEVEHAGLARARDAGFRRAARLGARDVAGGRALDVHARRAAAPASSGALRRRLVLLERQLQRAVAAELRAAGVQVRAQRGDGRSPVQTRATDAGPRVAEHALAVRIRAAADDAPVAEHHEVSHGQEQLNRVARKFRDIVAMPSVVAIYFRQLPHVRFELVVLVLDRVQEQALGQVRAPLVVVHLLDQVVDLAAPCPRTIARARAWR